MSVVNRAVTLAQTSLADAFSQSVVVEVDERLTTDQAIIVEDWLLNGPEWSIPEAKYMTVATEYGARLRVA